MKNNKSAAPKAGTISSILSVLPLVEADSTLSELTCSLRNLVAETHPMALFEIPQTSCSTILTIPGCEEAEACLLTGYHFSVVVFVDAFKEGGKVIGVASTSSKLVLQLFGGSLREIEEVVIEREFSKNPTWESWISFCRHFSEGLSANALENMLPVMDSFWQHEYSCYQKELARG